MHGLPGKFSLVQCSTCGWIRQNPRPVAEHLAKYYPEDYEPYRAAIEDEKGFWNRWDRRYGMIKRRRSIERFISSGRLLEIGCGMGIFLDEMRRKGWSVTGIEPNPKASEYARKRFELEIMPSTLEESDLSSESFDVICLWNVLEHLPAPASALKKLQSALKPGGLLVFSIPNLESLDRRLFGESWIGWELPRHLYLFPKRALSVFLEQNGMAIIAKKVSSGSYYGFLLSLYIYLRDHSELDRQTVYRLISSARQMPIRIMASPFFWILDELRLSPVLTYYIRKNS